MIKERYILILIILSQGIITTRLFSQSEIKPNVIEGPFLFRSQSPSQFFMPTPIPRSIPMDNNSSTKVRASYAISNYWSNDIDFKIDLQASDTVLDVSHSFGNGYTIILTASYRKAINAKMDQLVISFHDLLGMDQDGRLEVDKNDTLIDIPKYDIYLDKKFLKKYISKELNLGLQTTLINGGRSSYSLAITPFINGLVLESNKEPVITSATIQIDQQFPFSSSIFYLNLASTHLLDDHRDEKLDLKKQQWAAMLGFEYFFNKSFSFHTEYIALEPLIDDKELYDLTLISNEIQLGIKGTIGMTTVEFSIMENIFAFYNSADIGFHLGVSTRF